MSATSSAERSGSAGSSDPVTSKSRLSSSITSSAESDLTQFPSILVTNAGTHTLIHRSSIKSLPERHVSSSTRNSNTRISFAPLPNIEPRKRRSSNHIKLGVAARSEMMRQRRTALQGINDSEPASLNECEKKESAWQDSLRKTLSPRDGGELWQDQQRAPEMKSKGEPDPFIAMAKLMKSAWRKVSLPNVLPSLQAVSSTTSHNCVSSGGASEKSDSVEVDNDCIVATEEHSQEEGNGDKETMETTAEAGSEHQFDDVRAQSLNSNVLNGGELEDGHVLCPSKPVRSGSEPHDMGSTIWPAAATK